MERQQIVIEAGGMVTPLGTGIEVNYRATLNGTTRLCRHGQTFGMPEPFVASLFNRDAVRKAFSSIPGCPLEPAATFFEQLVILAVHDALQHLPAGRTIDLCSPQTLLILSSTKGNVSLMAHDATDGRILLGEAAQRVASFFGMQSLPIVVSNACISGVSAQILAQRLLRQGAYKHVIVVGADEQSRFIVSGFQSFKALSPARCRPYDVARNGLNLGEASAAMILSAVSPCEVKPGNWLLASGCVRNDANHISGPSRVGEGSYQALCQTMAGAAPDDLAFINAHGTATLYNDEMESIAISRAGLAAVPVNALKGVFGHTMGAAGILETLLSAEAVRHATVLPTHGFSRLGVSHPIQVSAQAGKTSKNSFIKLMSGFGGCNAAVRYVRVQENGNQILDETATAASADSTVQSTTACMPAYRISHTLSLFSDGIVVINGQAHALPERGATLLTAIYRKHINDYFKFFKMDPLCRLGFVAAELLLRQEDPDAEKTGPRSDRAVVVCSRFGSYVSDRRYQQTIAEGDYFPSPAVFVYTLANIVTGEIAIRHGLQGETSCFLLPAYQPQRVRQLAATAFCDPQSRSVVSAWLDCQSADCFEARLELLVRK